MGNHSRQRLPAGTVCYLCELAIPDDPKTWNRDHVPPDSFFGKAIKVAFPLNLKWEYTHRSCNSSYRSDEEYFVAAMAIHADHSMAGNAVVADYRRALQSGHFKGLYRLVLSQFGTVELQNGQMAFHWTWPRIERVLWKLLRGLLFQQTQTTLPHDHPRRIRLWTVTNRDQLELDAPWTGLVASTGSMSEIASVLDVKALGSIDDRMRAHAYVLLIWDSLVVTCLFHDPSCPCDGCSATRTGADRTAPSTPSES